MIQLTYDIEPEEKYTKEARCPLCGEYAAVVIIPRGVSIYINATIPFGKYDEIICQCSNCMKEFLIDDSFSKSLIPSKRSKIAANLCWLFLVIPFLNLFVIGYALWILPITSNRYRQWSKIALIPAISISFIFLAIALIALFQK